MVTASAQVTCDDCSESVEVEMIPMASSIPLFGVDNDIVEELADWEIDDTTQRCPECRQD